MTKIKLQQISVLFSTLKQEKINYLNKLYILYNQFSVRTYNALMKAGYKTILDIFGHNGENIEKLSNLKQLGAKSLDELSNYLLEVLYDVINDNVTSPKIVKTQWHEKPHEEKIQDTEIWLSKKDYLNWYLFDSNSTLKSIAKHSGVTSERIRQKIAKDFKKYQNEAVFYALNNKLTKRQYRTISNYAKKLKMNFDDELMKSNFIILEGKDLEKDKIKKQKAKLQNLINWLFIEPYEDFEEFEVSNYLLDTFQKQHKKIYQKHQMFKMRNLIARLERHQNLVLINQRKFIKVAIKKEEIQNICYEINKYFSALMQSNDYLFMSVNDKSIINEFGFSDQYSLHSFMKKYNKNSTIHYLHQPRVQKIKTKSVPQLVEMQLIKWNIKQDTSANIILNFFQQSNYNKLDIQILLKSLNREHLSFVYIDQTIKITKQKGDYND